VGIYSLVSVSSSEILVVSCSEILVVSRAIASTIVEHVGVAATDKEIIIFRRMASERARKKSAKQLLEEKQMKRYLRSKKRSQKRKDVSSLKEEIESQTRENLFTESTIISNKNGNELQTTCDNYSEQKFGMETTIGKTEDNKRQNGSDTQSKEQGKVATHISKKFNKEKKQTQSIPKEDEAKQEDGTDNNKFKQNLNLEMKEEQPFDEQCKNHEKVRFEGVIASDIDEETLKKDEETLTKDEENVTSKDVETFDKEKDLLLDIENIWADKYKYEDAEKQFYLLLEEGNKSSSDSMRIDYKTKENDLKLQNDITAKVVTKPRIAYEIIEEIVERTEITYHLIKHKTDTEHMADNIKRSESGSSDVDQYLLDLGNYVKSLETRVKILEEGKKGSESESAEGVDMTGKCTTAYKFDHMHVINTMKHCSEKDIPKMSRIMQESLCL